MRQKQKRALTSFPSICWLKYGQNNKEYWNYHQMVIQFEDVIDVLKVLYEDKDVFIFHFDHSAGHERLCPNGLCANTIN